METLNRLSSMIAPISSFAASPALAGLMTGRSLTALRMSGDAELKPWDVKQEGGQMDSGWGTGEETLIVTIDDRVLD